MTTTNTSSVFTTRKPTAADRIKGAFWRAWYIPYASLRAWMLRVVLPFKIAERRTL